MSRTKNSIRNISFGFLNRIEAIIIPFLFRTLIIKILGEEYLGLGTLFSSILQVLNVAELGFSNAITAALYKPISENDTDMVNALLCMYRRIYTIIGCFCLCMGLGLLPFLDKLIRGFPPEGINIYVLFIVYLCNTVISYFFYAYKVTLINAYQRMDLTEKVGAVSKLLITGVQLITIIVMKNIILYTLCNVICTLIYNLGCSYIADKYFPQYTYQGYLNKGMKDNIVKNVAALAIQKIGNTISISLDSIVISAYLGLTTVAIYGNYYYVISAITTFITLIYSSVTASVGNSIATETIEKNSIDFDTFSFLNIWIIGWCCICFMCLFQDFMEIWMGKDFLFPIFVVLTLVLRFFFGQIRKVVLTYKDAAGIWWPDKWRPLLGCIVNLSLNIFLVKKIGVAGVAISTIISYVFIEHPWETHVLFRDYFHKKELKYYMKMLYYIAGIVIAGVVSFGFCAMLPLSGIVAIIIKLVICIVLSNGIILLMNFWTKDFKNGYKTMVMICSSFMNWLGRSN